MTFTKYNQARRLALHLKDTLGDQAMLIIDPVRLFKYGVVLDALKPMVDDKTLSFRTYSQLSLQIRR
jgi:hypothetical protein